MYNTARLLMFVLQKSESFAKKADVAGEVLQVLEVRLNAARLAGSLDLTSVKQTAYALTHLRASRSGRKRTAITAKTTPGSVFHEKPPICN
jgi:hypothetical protein